MENNFAIVCDITCDLTDETRERYDIDYVRGYITYPDGTEERSFLNWNMCEKIPECDAEKFYTALKKNPNNFNTSPAGIQIYHDVFESYVKQGKGVVALSISSALSGACGFMLAAREQLLKEYPDARVEVIDTLRFTIGFGMLAIRASELRAAGKTLDETVSEVESLRNRVHQVGWLDDLRFVAKKGRMNNSKAYMGQLIGIKPVGEFDKNGMTTIIGKARGEKAAFSAILRYVEAVGENLGEQTIYIAQSNRMAQALEYKKLLEDRFSPKEVVICDVFPASGINVGPGLMAAYFYGKPISDGVVEEKELFKKILENK